MKRIFVTSVFVMVLLMISLVLATQHELSNEFEEFIKKVADAKGISEDKIIDIKKINFSDAPNEVKIENIDENNLAIYEVTQQGERTAFIITFSQKGFEGFPQSPKSYSTSFLTFGLGGNNEKSSFMDTVAGVRSSLDSGYVILRSGSITGVSTSLEISKADSEYVEIIIYKNGEAINFGNVISVSLEGHEKDYDLQSQGVVTFEPGDVISVYAKINKNKINDVITLVEITTEN